MNSSSRAQASVEPGPARPIAATLAAFCVRAQAQPLPAEVAERAGLCLADHLHSAVRGASTETCQRLIRYLGLQGGAPSAEATALMLGAASTVYEIDDVHHDTSMHTGSVVVAAALGCLADASIQGRRLLAAIAVGYEAGIRLSIAAGEPHYEFFHSTSTCGTVAAAATAAVIYGLTEDETAHAIGVAVTSASGLWEGINDEAIGLKHLHSGLAAERGIRAAKLARLGLRGAQRSIEGKRGFLAALAGPRAAAAGVAEPGGTRVREILLDGLGERWAILRNIYKRYPFCLACFEPLEGIRSIIESGKRRRDEVDSVLLELYPRSASIVSQPHPRDQLQAKFSATFAVALVLAGHDPEDVTLPPTWLADPNVTTWYPRIRLVAASTVPRRHARVTVRWKDGTEECADRPLRNLSEAEVRSRFTRACRESLGDRATAAETTVSRCADLETTADLSALVRDAMGL
jgi:2-methylcitrate dehydratase PrpD